jgi:hypothetical protein
MNGIAMMPMLMLRIDAVHILIAAFRYMIVLRQVA